MGVGIVAGDAGSVWLVLVVVALRREEVVVGDMRGRELGAVCDELLLFCLVDVAPSLPITAAGYLSPSITALMKCLLYTSALFPPIPAPNPPVPSLLPVPLSGQKRWYPSFLFIVLGHLPQNAAKLASSFLHRGICSLFGVSRYKSLGKGVVPISRSNRCRVGLLVVGIARSVEGNISLLF